MQITSDVIADLYPVYVSGEASADTRALVDDYLNTHPEFAARIRAQWSDVAGERQPGAAGISVSPDVELRSVKRTRHLMRVRSWLLAAAIYHTLLPFSFLYRKGQLHFFFVDSPLTMAVIGSAAVLFWFLWHRAGRQLKLSV